MLNNLLKKTYLYFNKIKIVHSIPGRVRLSVPGLSLIPKEVKQYEKQVTELIQLLNGIESVEYSYLTEKILIKYNPNIIDDKLIVEWLNIIFKKTVEKEKLVKDMSLKEVEAEFSTLYDKLKSELKTIIPKGKR